MKIKIILLLLAIFSLCSLLYLNEHKEAKIEKAFVLTGIGCLETDDSIDDFDNRQMLMHDMNLPTYQRCK